MSPQQPARLATIFVSSADHWHGQPLYSAIVHLCREQKIAGATVTRCVEGYGSSGHLHTMRLLELSEHVPLKVEIIDRPERIDALLEQLGPLIGKHLVTLADVTALRLDGA